MNRARYEGLADDADRRHADDPQRSPVAPLGPSLHDDAIVLQFSDPVHTQCFACDQRYPNHEAQRSGNEERGTDEQALTPKNSENSTKPGAAITIIATLLLASAERHSGFQTIGAWQASYSIASGLVASQFAADELRSSINLWPATRRG